MTFENENDNNDGEGIENQPLLPVNESITEELQRCENCHRTDVYVTVATQKDMHYQQKSASGVCLFLHHN
jgi:hypothetical protein